MTRSRTQLLSIAARLAAIGGSIGIVAGLAQATIGTRIPAWSGDKGNPVALGLLTIALSATVVGARTLSSSKDPRPESLTAITLWFTAVAVVCSTTVGRLWAIPGLLLVAAAGITLAGCGWQRFKSVVATGWLRGLLGILGAFEILMAVSAAPAVTVAAGLIAGGALIAAAILTSPSTRTLVIVLVAATLPFVALTWWTLVTALLSVLGFALGLAVTSRAVRSGEAGPSVGLLDVRSGQVT